MLSRANALKAGFKNRGICILSPPHELAQAQAGVRRGERAELPCRTARAGERHGVAGAASAHLDVGDTAKRDKQR